MSKYGTDFIKSLRTANYNYKPEMNLGNKVHFGVMAQDILKYLTEVNPDAEFNIVQTDKDENLMVNYNELIGPMIKTIQELLERVEELEENQK